MTDTQINLVNRLLENWAHNFEYEKFEVLEIKSVAFKKSTQNPYGVVRYDLLVKLQLTDIGEKIFALRFARSGEELSFYLVFAHLKE